MLDVLDRFKGLFRWVNRDDWSDAFEAHRDVSVTTILKVSGLSEDELFDRLGPGLTEALLAWVELDFLTTVRADGRNIVDEYLDRRGFKESTGTRSLMRAVRNSIPSLYEVVQKQPGGVYRLRDLLRQGGPVDVVASLPEGAVGGFIALRVVPAMGKLQPVGLPLPFPTVVIEQTLEHFRESIEVVDIGPGVTAAPVPDLPEIDRRLRACGSAFVLIWILSIVLGLKAEREPEAEVDQDDIDPAEPHAVEFPFLATTTGDAVRERLEGDERLRDFGDNLWSWAADPRFDAMDPDEEEDVFTFDVTIEGNTVVAVVMNGLLAEDVCAILAEILEGLVGDPMVAPLDMDALVADLREAEIESDDGFGPGPTRKTRH